MNEILITTDDLELQKCAEGIRAEHQLCVQSMRKGLEHALKVGELLIQAKELLKHGRWTNWVKQNCDFSPRMARNYTRVARGLPYLKTESISVMTLQDALDRVDFETRKLTGPGKKEKNTDIGGPFDPTPEVGWILEYLSAWTKKVDEFVDATELGKFSPEAKAFTARRAQKLITKLNEWVDILD